MNWTLSEWWRMRARYSVTLIHVCVCVCDYTVNSHHNLNASALRSENFLENCRQNVRRLLNDITATLKQNNKTRRADIVTASNSNQCYWLCTLYSLTFHANQMMSYNYFICVPHKMANAILKCICLIIARTLSVSSWSQAIAIPVVKRYII